MLSIFGMLGLLMAGIVGSSVVMRADTDAEGEADEPAGADEEVEAAPPDGQIWDDEGEGAVTDSRAPLPGILDYALGDVQGVEEHVPTVHGLGHAEFDSSGAPDEGGGRILIGSGRDDGLEGGAGNDLIVGGAGEDQLIGLDGSDTLMGEAGNDTLHGDYGDDLLLGGDDDDYLAGHEGNDLLQGDAGNDTLLGGNGDDTLLGGAGDDWLSGGMGNDLLVAGPGQDTLDGDAGDDTLIGGFFGEAGNVGNYLNGGLGNDLLRVGAGDIATGGEGADRFELSADMQGRVATVMDYEPGIDELVVIYDAAGPLPQIALVEADHPDDVMVLLNGQPLANIIGGAGMLPEAIRLEAR